MVRRVLDEARPPRFLRECVARFAVEKQLTESKKCLVTTSRVLLSGSPGTKTGSDGSTGGSDRRWSIRP